MGVTEREESELAAAKCYELDGVLYVPHYTRHGVFARPGYTEGLRGRTGSPVAELELQLAGATAVTRILWARAR